MLSQVGMQKKKLISRKQNTKLKGKPSEVLIFLMGIASEVVNKVVWTLSTDNLAYYRCRDTFQRRLNEPR